MESLLIYGIAGLISGLIVLIYIRKLISESRSSQQKIEKAKEEGIYEPVSLYPYIDPNSCIRSGACIMACPEEEIIGIRNGRATLINASRCVGHGACFHACPVEAITLRIGTDKRGVDLPHVNQNYETNIRGIYIAGELGGMGLIKNSVDQGRKAVENIAKTIEKGHKATYDLIVIGAGPAGISASLQAKKSGLNVLTLEQDTLGGTVYNFPRAKVVMTNPMELPGYGKLKFFQTSKKELLDIWNDAIQKNDLEIVENCKVESILLENEFFTLTTNKVINYTTHRVLIAIGRRGTPRKLGVKGEDLEKVAYKLLEPELIRDKHILVVGGGDSAIESALLLAEQNSVTLSYRSEKFSRLKPKNLENIVNAQKNEIIEVILESNVKEITETDVFLELKSKEIFTLKNDLVFIFAGGELPTRFLENAGIQISKRFNYTLLSHKK
ncbi:MAG TPA: 4Fe-4S ferredoxin [Saprospirales bacterium]|nr:4Fe-4S ferredoxin [Saprospirales bacterium]HAY71159.1 4Fe-4S ferredoxin [Saprospirales bacterium]HRQ28684.1 NAD(P)-binding domain-containing protein [Saprospiraceae bacterium]